MVAGSVSSLLSSPQQRSKGSRVRVNGAGARGRVNTDCFRLMHIDCRTRMGLVGLDACLVSSLFRKVAVSATLLVTTTRFIGYAVVDNVMYFEAVGLIELERKPRLHSGLYPWVRPPTVSTHNRCAGTTVLYRFIHRSTNGHDFMTHYLIFQFQKHPTGNPCHYD